MSNWFRKMPVRLLVVDDELSVRYALRRAFDSEYSLIEATSAEEARERFFEHRPDLILLDHNLPGEDGLTWLREIGNSPDAPAVIMITGRGSERIAVEAMKAGAFDYLTKPYDLDELRLIIQRALERQQLRTEVRDLRERLAAEGQFGCMIGASAVMRDLFISLDRVANSDLPVLLLGESGTGKDLVAQEIHARSPRSQHRLVILNCAALPETLVESELFGYERGAFTGATETRSGKFEQAHGGTLFLDEIGDMAIGTQAKILRVAESGTVERLGGRSPRSVDVRIVAATNQDLSSAIQGGHFRQDLFFRLAGVTMHLPPLRQRRDDIPLLVARFWQDLQRKYGRVGPTLTSEAIIRLAEEPWPGNVRQLRSTVEKIFVLTGGESVSKASVEQAIEPTGGSVSCPDDLLDVRDFREARRRFEVAYLTRKLHEHGGNVTRTAAGIGIERQSLQEKIRQLGVPRS